MSVRLAPGTKLRREFSVSVLLFLSQLLSTLTCLGRGGSLLVVEGEGQGWELGRILEKGDQSWNGGGLFPSGKSVVGNRFVLGMMRSRLRNKGSLS